MFPLVLIWYVCFGMCALVCVRLPFELPAPPRSAQCGFVSAKFDTFLDLSLEIPTRAQAQRASIELRVCALSIVFFSLNHVSLFLFSGQSAWSEQTHGFPLNEDTHSFASDTFK